MAEKIISPGVFSKEIDASFLPAAVGDIGAVIVGPTVKGPALTPTVVTSYSEFQAKFGDSFKSGSGYYQYLTSQTARNYLRHQSTLTVVRVMGAGYSAATATISSSIDPAIVGGGVKASGSITVLPGGVAEGGWGKHGIQGQASMSIGTLTMTATGSAYSGDKNSATQLYFISGANVTATAANFRDVLNNSSSLHGLPISASSGLGVVGLTASYAGPVHETLDHLANQGSATWLRGTLNFASGAASGLMFGCKAMIGGENYSSTYKTPIKLHTLSHGSILNNSASVGTNNLLSDGNSSNIRWEIGNVNQKKGSFSVIIRRGDDIEKKKQILETWKDCTLDPNTSNYVAKVIGDQYITVGGTAADPFLSYVGDFPNKSKYVRVEVIEKTPDYLDENGNVRVPAYSASLPTYHSGSNSGSAWGSFSGGFDGTLAHPILFNENISNTNTQGFNLGVTAVKDQYMTALNLLANADEYDFNLLLLPGVVREHSNHTAIVTKAIDVCESRGDAFFIADTAAYATNAIGTVTDQAKAIDSNYAATYWPWVQVNDSQTGKNVWVPPSVVMAGIYASNDKVADPWFAPAGLNRGVISTAIQAKRKLTTGIRDTLYDANVNPIATFPAEGVTVWGQKTLQKKDSALDRVNVRRLMIKVKKFISASSRFLVFEQNNTQTRQRFLSIATPFLQNIKEKSGLNEFKIIMDGTNNTPDVVDRNILYGQIFVQPTRTAEFIILDFTIQPTGAAFPE
jgi:hypothetical protein